MAITRHGINRQETGALARCSFEETVSSESVSKTFVLMEAELYKGDFRFNDQNVNSVINENSFPRAQAFVLILYF